MYQTGLVKKWKITKQILIIVSIGASWGKLKFLPDIPFWWWRLAVLGM